MKDSGTPRLQLKGLLDQALKTLQDPLCDPFKPEYKSVTSLLTQVDFFHKIFNSPLEFNDFIDISKFYFEYEVVPYGTLLMKEKGHADKFFLVLKGTAYKLHQRSYKEVEQEFKSTNFRLETNGEQDSENEPNSASPKLSLRTERLLRLETSSSDRNHSARGKTRGLQRMNTGVIKVSTKTASENTDFKDYSPRLFLRKDTVKIGQSSPKAKLSLFSNKDNNCVSTQATRLSFHHNLMLGGWHSPRDRLDSDNESKKSCDSERRKPNDIATDFVRDLVAKNPDLSHRCFLGDTVRVEITHAYREGEYFGENFHKQNQPIETSMVAVGSEEVHLLTLTKENLKIISEELSKRENERTQLFRTIFPNLEEETVHEFSQYFNRRHYRIGEAIYYQNEKAKSLCLLKSGNINFTKAIEILPQIAIQAYGRTWVDWTGSESGRKLELPLASIVGGQFFGEELLLKEKFRQYTAVANTPDTVVYLLDLSLYKQIRYEFKAFFDILRANAEEKFAWREKKVSEYVEHQKIFSETQALEPALPELWKNRSSPSARNSIALLRESSHEMRTNMSPSPEPVYLKTEGSSPLQKSKFFTGSPHGSNSPSVVGNLELYKGRFSRKIKAIPQGESKGSPKESNGGMKDILEEFNLRKDIQGGKKLKLPTLHIAKKSSDPMVSKSVRSRSKSNTMVSTPKHKVVEDKVGGNTNSPSPRNLGELQDQIVTDKAGFKKMLRYVSYIPVHHKFIQTNLKNLIRAEKGPV